MKIFDRMNRVLVLITIALALIACTGQPASPTPTATIAPTATTTPTQSPTATVTPTPFPTIDPGIPTPDFRESLVGQSGYLLSSMNDPNCQLPCWHGLRIGESTSADVEDVFLKVFGFEGWVDMFHPPRVLKDAVVIEDWTGLDIMGYLWDDIIDKKRLWFGAAAIVDDKTQVLQGLYFVYIPGMEFSQENLIIHEGYFTVNTIQQQIQALGRPDFAYARVLGGEVKLNLLYGRGILLENWVPITWDKREYVNNTIKLWGHFCVDTQRSTTREYLIAPFKDVEDLDNFTTVQKQWIGYVHDMNTPTLEESFGITIDELTEKALSDESPCFYFGPDS